MDSVRAAYDSDVRVCSYDRANQGQSGSALTPRTADDPSSRTYMACWRRPRSQGNICSSAIRLVASWFRRTPQPLQAKWRASSRLTRCLRGSSGQLAGSSTMNVRGASGETDYYAWENGESLNYREISERIEGLGGSIWHTLPCPDLDRRPTSAVARTRLLDDHGGARWPVGRRTLQPGRRTPRDLHRQPRHRPGESRMISVASGKP
jgi:hypothetical protein